MQNRTDVGKSQKQLVEDLVAVSFNKLDQPIPRFVVVDFFQHTQSQSSAVLQPHDQHRLGQQFDTIEQHVVYFFLMFLLLDFVGGLLATFFEQVASGAV